MNRLRRRATNLLCALALSLVLGLAGCGSDSEPGPTRTAFIEQANEICDQNNEYLRQAMVETFGADQQPDAETGIRFTRKVWVPNLRQQNEDLRELDWPEEDRPEIERMLEEHERATERVEADPGVASQGPFDEVTDEMTAYGIGPCGSP